MTEDLRKKQDELTRIQDELKSAGLSRRHFLNRLSTAGIGFGAAYVLTARNAEANAGADASLKVGSTNPAVENILPRAGEGTVTDSAQGQSGDSPKRQLAQYGRVYVRYSRAYVRYVRYYQRVYVRF